MMIDTVYDRRIKSVQTFREGFELAPPVIIMGENEFINLVFDEITTNAEELFYYVVHCDASWISDDLKYNDYAEGFVVNRMNEGVFSQATHCNYLHHKLRIPNDELQFKISGNYILFICRAEDMSKPILSRRFYIAESNVEVEGMVHRPVYTEFYENMQEIDFTVELNDRSIYDPSRNISVHIIQNGRPDRMITNLKPSNIKGSILEYNFEKENLFLGGDEFRHFNSRNLLVPMENIFKIEYHPPYNHIYLQTDTDRAFAKYTFKKDINGRFYPDSKFKEERDNTADYVVVEFRLPVTAPLLTDDVCLYGAFSGWDCNADNIMKYDFEAKEYKASLFLKQGYYNYCYVLRSKKTGLIDGSYFERDFYETENEYLILIYYTGQGERYQRLLGSKVISSFKD